MRALIVLANLSKPEEVEAAMKILVAVSNDPANPLPIVLCVREPGTPFCEPEGYGGVRPEAWRAA